MALDVGRGLHWAECARWGAAERAARVAALLRVLDAVFPAARAAAFPFYVQGAHDVAAVLLLTLGEARAVPALHALARGALRGALLADLRVPAALLARLPALIARADAPLARALARGGAGALPPYALPWLLTWFAHSVASLGVAQALFDGFLVSHPLTPLYAAAALVAAPGARAGIAAALAAQPPDEGALYAALARAPDAALATRDDAARILAAARALAVALPPAALLAGAPADDVRLLREEWPELWTWRPPPPPPPPPRARAARLLVIGAAAAALAAVGAALLAAGGRNVVG